MKPFLKWAGGKRWLVERAEFCMPDYSGRYIEPFLGGAAVFLKLQPQNALLSDANPRLINAYRAIRDDWSGVWERLKIHQKKHSKEYYYDQRSKSFSHKTDGAAQFIYLNRTCWNGLYRENLKGEFNVPIGTKTKIIFEDDNFEALSKILSNVEIICNDFEVTLDAAIEGDFVFVDPPYTVAHNLNGFVKYNEKIFSWEDQKRLSRKLFSLSERGVHVMVTNAAHDSVRKLYEGATEIRSVPRHVIISGSASYRRRSEELLITV